MFQTELYTLKYKLDEGRELCLVYVKVWLVIYPLSSVFGLYLTFKNIKYKSGNLWLSQYSTNLTY